jgi:hypothetical protein
MRQVHRKEMDLAFHATDHRQRFAKVGLRMARIVTQRHKHLALALTLHQHVILDDGYPPAIAALVTQTLKNPLRRVPLLGRAIFVLRQDLIDEPDKPVQLRAHRRPTAPISGRHRKRQHLRHRARINPKATRRFASTDPLNSNPIADPTI